MNVLKKNRRSPLWPMMTDVGFQLIVVLVFLIATHQGVAEAARRALGIEKGKHRALATALVTEEEKTDGLQKIIDDAHEELEFYADKGKEYAGIVETLEQAIGEQGEQIGQLTEELNALRPGPPIDLLILVDCSASMRPHHRRLRSALLSLFKMTPRLSTRCRIGVLGIRNGVVFTYELETIVPRYKDKGVSANKLLGFMDSMTTQTSNIDHSAAFKKAFEMLPDRNRKGTRQVILTLSDTGTGERDGKAAYSESEMQEGRKIVADVRSWASKGNRAVGCIYVGPDEETSIDRKWFQALAQPSVDNFAAHSAEIFSITMRAIDQ